MTRFIRLLALAPICAILFAFPVASQDTASQIPDSQRLRGAWRVISARDEGRDKPAVVGNLYLFDSAKLHIFTPQGKRTVYRYELDQASDPKQMTLLTDDDLFSRVAIYKFDENLLSFCSCYKPGVVPSDFTTKPGDGCTSLVLKRDLDH